MRKKIVATLMAGMILVGMLTGCGSGETQSGKESANTETQDAETEALSGDFANIDMSDHVDLVISIFGVGAPTDLELINEKVSEITEEKLNCSVEIQIMENLQQYSLYLSTGEPIDLIWSATWNNCYNYSKQGAFMDITDMVNTKFPDLKALIGEDRWDAIAVNGKYYMIPSNNQSQSTSWTQWGVAWREDIRKQLGCEEIVDWVTLEAFAKAVKESDLGMIPFFEGTGGSLWHTMIENHHLYTEFGGQNTLALDLDTLEIVDFTDLDYIKDYCETQRRWVEEGYFEPDIASSTDTGVDGVLSGKYAGTVDNVYLQSYVSDLLAPIKSAHPDWEMGYISYAQMFEMSYSNSPAQQALAIPKSAPNAERALAFMELMMTDAELYNLIDLGIYGTHYEIDEDGYYVNIQGEAQTYSKNNWLTNNYINEEAKVYTEDDEWAMNFIEENMMPYEVENFWTDFPFDVSDYSEYVTACSNVYSQYWAPLLQGATSDFDGTMKNLKDQSAANGMDVIEESLRQQWKEYVEEKGIKGLGQ